MVDATELLRCVRGLAGKIDKSRSPRESVRGFRRRLREHGFQANASLPGVDLLRLIHQRQGNCVELSVLHVLFGRMTGIPIHAIRIPDHMFVRIGTSNDFTNMEPTVFEDGEYTNEYYARRCGRKTLGVYSQELTDDQLVAEIIHALYYPVLSNGGTICIEGRASISEALQTAPASPDLMNSIGLNYLRRNQPAKAEKWFLRALDFDTDCLPAISNLMQSFAARGRHHEVISIARTYHTEQRQLPRMAEYTREGFVELQSNLARSFLRVGDYQSASDLYQQLNSFASLVRSTAGHTMPYVACLCYFVGDYDRAADASLAWSEAVPAAELGKLWAISAFIRSGRWQRAISIQQTARFRDHVLQLFSEVLCGFANSDDRSIPEYRLAESEVYAGERWASIDPKKACAYWKRALPKLSLSSFEHLRAERCLNDLEASSK